MKNSLDPQTFIYFAATDKAFRNKYFAKPNALAKDFAISKTDLTTIKKIDFQKLKSELATIDSGIKKITKKPQGTCHESHNKHANGPHTSGTHTNNCKGAVRVFMGKSLKRMKTS